MIIYVFCDSCEPEIVHEIKIVNKNKTKTISRSQPISQLLQKA